MRRPTFISPRRQRFSGFSLAELMIGLTVLSTGFLFTLGVFPASLSAVHHGRERLVATQLAHGALESQRCRPFTQMAAASNVTMHRSLANNQETTIAYVTTITVSPANLSNATKATLTTQVSWVQGTITRYVRVSETRAKEDM